MANVKFLTGTQTNLLKKNSDGSYVNPIVEGSLYVTAEKTGTEWVSQLYYDYNGQRMRVGGVSDRAAFDSMNQSIVSTYIKQITMEGSTYASTDGATLTYTKGDGSTVTILLPLASETKAGTVNTGNQTFAGNKTFKGQVILQGGTDTAGTTANSGALIIGSPTGAHISMDANEIQAKAASGTTAQLHINNDGGITQFGGIIQPKTDNAFTLGTEKLRWKTVEAVTVNATTFNGSLNGNVKGNLDGNAATADKWYTARTITLGSDLQGSVSIDGSKNVTLNANHYNVSCSSNNKSNYPWHRIATTNAITSNNADKDMTIVIRHGYNGGGYGVAKVSLRTNSGTSVAAASVKWLYRYNIEKENLQIGLRNTAGNALADLYYKVGTWARATIYQVEGNRSWTLIASSEVSDTTTTDKKTSKEVYLSVADGGTILGAGYTSTVKASDGAIVQNANYASSADGAITDEANHNIQNHYLSSIVFDGTTNHSSKVVAKLIDGKGAEKVIVDFPTASASQAGAITTGSQTLTGAKIIDANGSLEVKKNSGFNFSGIGTASDAVARHVWFSHSSQVGTPIRSDKFKYNPAATDNWATLVANSPDETGKAYGKLIVDVLEGIAARAYADDRGQQISKKYVASLSFDGATNKTTKVTMTYNDGTGAEIKTVDFPTASATVAGAITTGTQTLTGAKTLDANGSLTIQKASGFNYSGIENATSNQARHIWFSHASNVGTPVKNDKFKLNPGATDAWATVVANAFDKTGSAYSKLIVDVVEGMAARAYADDRGQKISSKYVASMTFSGTGSTVTLTYRDGAGADIGTTNIPNASSSAAGVITTGAQTIAGDKTFTGRVYIKNTSDAVLGTADTGALIIGDKAGEHIVIDSNEIMGKANGTTSRQLLFQWEGGDTGFGGMILPKTNNTSSVGNSSTRWGTMYAYTFNATTQFTTAGGTFYANSSGNAYFANSVGLRVTPDDNYALKIAGNTYNNGVVYFGNGTTNYVNNSADARFNTVGINGSNTTYRLYVNGNTLNNGIVYFANGTTYYINNSADARLRYGSFGNVAPSSSYALTLKGNVFLNGIHYFANGTTYYVDNSGVAHFKNMYVNGVNTTYQFAVGGTGYFSSNLTVGGDMTINGDTNFKGNLLLADGKQIRRNGKSTSWKTGRDSAILREMTSTGYHVIWSAKTTNGTWDIGEYNNEGYYDHLLFTYVTDTRYSSGDNGQDAQFRFRNNGLFQAPYISINTANTSYRLYVNGTSYFNGNATHNGIVYFANGTTYFINNSGNGHLSTLAIAGDSSDTYSSKGYQLYVGGTTLHKSSVYFANGTNYYINGSADTRLRYMVIGGTSLSPSSTYPLQVIGHAAITGDIKMRTGNTAIHWNDGTYQQRIITTDDSTANTDVFRFQQSADTATTWKDLFRIQDDGVTIVTDNTGQFRKTYTAASAVPTLAVVSNNIDATIWRVVHGTSYGGHTGQSGYSMVYRGTGASTSNFLTLYADNLSATAQNIAYTINQTGEMGIRTDAVVGYALYVNGKVKISQGEDATSATTGALQVTGGISVQGASWFKSTLTSEGALYIGSADATKAILYLNKKIALRGIDTWLRINDTVAFTSGVYFGKSLVMTDNELRVRKSDGSANTFYANSSGNAYISNTLGIGGTNTSHKLYVNGTTLHNGIVYFANGNIYFVDNSGQGKFNKLNVGYTGTTFDTGYTVKVNGTGYFENTLTVNNHIYGSLADNCLDITVDGDANTYYPVIITNRPTQEYAGTILSITRGYNEKGPDTWNTATHRGGLTLTLLWNGSRYWDGNGAGSFDVHTTNVLQLKETYTTMVAGLDTSSSGLVVWLRGGGAIYHIYSQRGNLLTASVKLTSYTDSASRVFAPKTSIDSNNLNSKRHWVLRGGDTMLGTLNTQHIYPKTDNTYNAGSSTMRYKEIHGYTITAHTKFATASGLFYVNNSDGKMYVANQTGLGVAPDSNYTLKVTGNTFHNGIVYFGNGTTYYINNSGTANLNGLTTAAISLFKAGIRIGSNANGDNNYIAFYGTTGDGAGSYNHTYIGENKWNSSIEASELLLFKGNDIASNTSMVTATGSGPDRIRHVAAGHLFQVMTAAISGDWTTVKASTSVKNIFEIFTNGVRVHGTTYFSSGSTYFVNNSAHGHLATLALSGDSSDSYSSKGYKLYVGGTAYFKGDVTHNANIYLPKNGQIFAIGSKVTSSLIRVVDNTVDTYGNGISIGGGGLVVVGAGESASNMVSSAGKTGGDENLYLTADGVINIEAGGDTIANRRGIQIGTNGNIIPVIAEAAQSVAFNIGTTTNAFQGMYSNWIHANAKSSSTDGGFTLYGGSTTYSIYMRTTATQGTHGYTTGDWATYFNMNDSTTRGWIFKAGGRFVASISGAGYIVANRLSLQRANSADYGRIYWYNTNYKTWITYMSNNASASCPTGGTPSVTTEVSTWALRSLIENTAGYGWIWEACANTSTGTPTARMSLSSNTGRLRIEGNASSNSNITGQLIVSSEKNGSSGNTAIELWRGGNASWQMANESGTFYIRSNYTSARQSTYSVNSLILDYNTGAASLPYLALGQTARNTSYRLYVYGTSYFYSHAYLPSNASIIQNQGSTSNYTTVVKWYKGGTSQATYDPQIGQHNTGGDGTGSISILPYATATSPWGGTVGLFIQKNLIKLDDKRIPTTGNNTGTVGSGTKPIYSNAGVLTASSSTVGGTAKPIYLNAGTITACSATVGSTTKPVYMNAGTITAFSSTIGGAAKPVYINAGAITACSSTVGGTTRPVYMNAGTITAITSVGTAYGGTGVTSHTANRLVWSTSATTIQAGYHYADSTKVAINYASAPSYNFYVSGTAYHTGRLYLAEWIQFTGTTGLYFPNSGAGTHLYPNTVSTYGSFMLQGAKGGYIGFLLGPNNTYMNVMTNGTNEGLYNQSTGRWIIHYNRSSNLISIGGSSVTSGYVLTVSGSQYVSGSVYVTGQFKVAKNGGSWISGRANAAVVNSSSTTSSSFAPIFSAKVQGGSWDVGPCHPNTNLYFSYATDTNYNAGTNTTNYSIYFTSAGYIYATRVYKAVWNDYAEFREAKTEEPGRVVIEGKFGVMKLSTERLQPGGNIISDTYGDAMGQTEKCKTPIAIAGRVLAYTYEDINSYELGDAVCTGPNGTVSKMSREEIREWPDRIIGTVSEIPTYETWGTGNIKVNGRIWIKVK